MSLLKLNVFKNSVLEGSGLDFGGSRARFQRGLGPNFRQKIIVFLAPLVRKCFSPASYIHSKVWANCSQNVGFHFPMCLQQCSPADASLQCMAVPQHSCTQMGRRRWPPLGGVQSAAHRKCAGRARLEPHCSQPKLQIYYTRLSS